MTRFLIKVFEKHHPDYLGMVFDAGDSERVELYPQYKATREKMPDELALSLPPEQHRAGGDVREMFGIP